MRLTLTLLSLPLLSLASPFQFPISWPRSPSQNRPAEPTLRDASNLLFASFNGLMKQWDNTFYPNGHSIILGTIPIGTRLYHARKNENLPPKIEWLAFDAEMSYGIMGARGGLTYMLTYSAAKPLRVLVLDGQSAALGPDGWLDSQSVLLYGNISDAGHTWASAEYERAQGLCKLGRDWGFDGVVRMNAGFEVLFCDFSSQSLSLVHHLNVTDPFAPEGYGFPAPPDDPNLSLLSSRFSNFDGPDQQPPWRGRRPPYGPPGRRPGLPPPTPFAGTATWEWQRSASWHYTLESRVVLDPKYFISFYDTDVKSLYEERKKLGNEDQREKQRLLGISKGDAEEVRYKVKQACREKNYNGWSRGYDQSVGSDWAAISDAVVDRYKDRLGEIRWVVQNSTDNSTTKAVNVRSLTYSLLMPYLDMSNYSDTQTHWINSSVTLCTHGFTTPPSNNRRFEAQDQNRYLTHGEKLINGSIVGVLGRVCETVAMMFKETIELDLPTFEASVVRMDEEERVEQVSAEAVENWSTKIEDLMSWLGWTVWERCDKVCERNEICSIPMWPLGGFWKPGGPGQDPQPTKIVPKCVSKDAHYLSM